MTVRDTSREAYQETTEERAKCQQRILAALRKAGATSRRAIASMTGLEVSCVAGRVNELIKVGLVREQEQPQPCPITGRNVHWIEAAEAVRAA